MNGAGDAPDELQQAMAMAARALELPDADGLPPVEEAVRVLRPHVDANLAVAGPTFAELLSIQGARLLRAGRRRKALATLTELVAVRRQLAALDLLTHGPWLVDSLRNLSRLVRVRRSKRCLPLQIEIVATCRALVDLEPAYGALLAVWLDRLADHLARVGRLDDAIDRSSEARQILRPLHAEDPAAYALPLALCLSRRASLLSHAKRWDEAAEAADEAHAHIAALADADPTYEDLRHSSQETVRLIADRERTLHTA